MEISECVFFARDVLLDQNKFIYINNTTLFVPLKGKTILKINKISFCQKVLLHSWVIKQKNNSSIKSSYVNTLLCLEQEEGLR